MAVITVRSGCVCGVVAGMRTLFYLRGQTIQLKVIRHPPSAQSVKVEIVGEGHIRFNKFLKYFLIRISKR